MHIGADSVGNWWPWLVWEVLQELHTGLWWLWLNWEGLQGLGLVCMWCGGLLDGSIAEGYIQLKGVGDIMV